MTLPLVKSIWPSLVSTQIVSVQPMNLPSGTIFYTDYKYEEKKMIDFEGILVKLWRIRKILSLVPGYSTDDDLKRGITIIERYIYLCENKSMVDAAECMKIANKYYAKYKDKSGVMNDR
jgi:hypothetical protein